MKKIIISAVLMGLMQCVIAKQAEPFSVVQPNVIQNMVPNSSQALTYQLTTTVPAGSGAVNVHCAFTSSSPYLTASFNGNGCTSAGGIGINSSLPATISLTLSVASQATGTVSGTLSFSQTNGRKYSKTYQIPITIPTTTNRTVTFKNFCPFAVNFGISTSSVPAQNNGSFHACSTNADCSAFTYSQCVNGYCGGGACQQDSDCLNSTAGTCAVPSGSPAGTSAACTICATDSDCIAGAKCGSNNLCYWAVPTPSDAAQNHYSLAAPNNGVIATDTLTISDNSSQNGYALLWGGGFAGRTSCTFNNGILTCNTAGCNTNVPDMSDGNGGCSLGEGFAAPSTLAEVTFVSNAPDTYDVSVINGVNIPLAMYPTPGSAATAQSYNNPYLCGKPGNPQETRTNGGNLGACSWNFIPPQASGAAFRWVNTDGGAPCSSDGNCTSPMKCGLTTALVSAGSASTVCGTPLGYWNQNEICAINASYNQPNVVNCTIANVQGTGNSMLNLLQCTGPAATSCYTVTGATTTCCGCTNWQNYGITIPTNPSIVSQCTYPNPYWAGSTSVTGYVLPNLIWLKTACPSAYVFPFDDATSTFTCPSNQGQSAVNYTVEFCPPIPA